MAIKLTYGKTETEVQLPDDALVAAINRKINLALKKNEKFVTVTNKDGKAESIVAADVVRVWEE
jgi:hypothetical protein